MIEKRVLCTRYDYAHGIEHYDLLLERRVSIMMRELPLTYDNEGKQK
jgi:hypothetical protein